MINPDFNKAIFYYKTILKLTNIINSKKIKSAIWADNCSLGSGDVKIITKKEIIRQARKKRVKLKKQLLKIQSKYPKQFKIAVKKTATLEYDKGF